MIIEAAHQFANFCDAYFDVITMVFVIVASIIIALILVTAKSWLTTYLHKSFLENQYRRHIQ